jgi:high-affinity iron transporter
VFGADAPDPTDGRALLCRESDPLSRIRLVLPTFVIGLREGLEAALIIGIIAAFLLQRGEHRALTPMWAGVGFAIVLCGLFAVAVQAFGRNLTFTQREVLEATLSIVAVAGVTYMVVWMKRHSRELKGQLETEAAAALARGSVWALVAMAFFAVIREGLETAIFLLAAFQSSENPAATGGGAVLGVAAAVVLGWLLFKGGIRINLTRFFRVTGFVLVIVAAGLLSYAVHGFAEAGLIEAAQGTALNLTWLLAPGSLQEAVISGALGIRAQPTYAEVAAWFAYAIPMAVYVLWPQRRTPRQVRVEAAVAS